MPDPTPSIPGRATPAAGELALPDDGALDGEVVETPRPREYALRPVVRPVVVVINVVIVVARHPHARRAARHAGYVPAGAVVLHRRRRRGRDLALDFAGIAKGQGDHEHGLQWHERHEAAVKARHDRLKERWELALAIVKASPWIIGAAIFLMLLADACMIIDTRRWGDADWSFVTLAHLVGDAVAIGSSAIAPLAIATPAAAVVALHEAGRKGGDLAPGWSAAAKAPDGQRDLVVTADTIVLALQHLDKITALKKAFASGWRPAFTLLPVRDGRGYEAEFSVPLGVTPEMIADQRPVLARNLHREEIETWPSAGRPGYARLWVADPGAIGKAAPEYPLLHEGQADVFEGVPGGVLARGDGALIPVVGNNGVFGGMMGQGKSNAARVLLLGCATDPLCGIDVFTFANNGDFDAYAPRLATYRKGLDDDVIAAAVDRLHELYRQVGEREQMLADLGAKKVTRQLALQYPELRPHVSLFSECHELFGHPEYGEIAGELAIKTAKRARKTAEVLEFDTQSSRKSAIPPALVELVSVNCCFAVKSWRSNDGFLGDGSFAAGIRATELRPGRDRGTSLVTGVSDAQFELLKWYFVEVNDDTGYDAAAEVIARCMKSVAPGTPVAAGSPVQATVVRDLLGDLAEVIGPERSRVADLPARLRKVAPSWLPYRALTGTELKRLLDDERVRTTNTGNVRELDPADLRRAIGEREAS